MTTTQTTRTTPATTPPVYAVASTWSMCESKRPYASFGEAVHVAVLRAAHVAGGLRPYRCPLCGCWHLTSKPRRDGRER